MGIDLLWIIMIPHSIWDFFLIGKLYLVCADIENEVIQKNKNKLKFSYRIFAHIKLVIRKRAFNLRKY